jgi:leucyl aminopeptidase
MGVKIRLNAIGKSFKHYIFLCNDEKSPAKLSSGIIPRETIRYIQQRFAEGDQSVIINGPENFYCFTAGADKPSDEKIRRAGDLACTQLNKNKAVDGCLYSDCSRNTVMAFLEGMVLGSYQFLKYRSDFRKKANTLRNIYLSGVSADAQEIASMERRCQAVYKARDLVNEPHSYLTAKKIADYMSEAGKKTGISVRILGKSAIASLRMGGLLAVNSGSKEPPTFTIMEYKPPKAVNRNPIVLVGKGVVFDTGGINLKTAAGLEDMKSDMAGAAAAGMALHAIASDKLPVYIVALIPATDNKPSATACVPGDIIKMSDGTTVEIMNTDAEGRLILADAIVYAARYKPSLIITLATLTGAAQAAIGNFGTVAMQSKASSEMEMLRAAGDAVHERLWEFPFWEDYDELIKSETADLKNTGGRLAGAITAGKFLAHFAKSPFIHLDIAGPAFTDKRDSYRGHGGTGTGVRLLYEFCKRMAAGASKE